MATGRGGNAHGGDGKGTGGATPEEGGYKEGGGAAGGGEENDQIGVCGLEKEGGGVINRPPRCCGERAERAAAGEELEHMTCVSTGY